MAFPSPVSFADVTRHGEGSFASLRHLAAALLAVFLSIWTACPEAFAASMDVEFYAVADKEALREGELLNVTVTLSHAAGSGDETLILPEFAPDFRVVSRSTSEQKSFSLSGSGSPVYKRIRVYDFVLAPSRTGQLTIPAGKLRLAGKSYETAPIKVTVSPGSSNAVSKAGAQDGDDEDSPSQARGRRSRGGRGNGGRGSSGMGMGGMPDPFAALGGLDGLMDQEDLESLEQLFGLGGRAGQERRNAELQDSDIFIRTVLDKKKVFLGEQVTMSIILYARRDVSGVNGMKMPKLDGFWAEDIETPSQISGEERVIDGVSYRAFLLRRKALFPLKSGKLTIDRVEAEISTSMGLFFAGGRKVQRKSAAVTLEVMPLPAGAPKDFEASNVGVWKLAASATPDAVPLGQPVTLKLSLEGKGNLKNVNMPPLPDIPGFKAYEPTTTERISTSHNRFGGRRTFEYLLMPSKTGDFSVPALEFSYFDPALKKYKTTKTAPIQLKVTSAGGGDGLYPLASLQSGTVLQGAIPAAVNVLDAGGIKPLRYRGQLSHPRKPLAGRPWFFPLVASPFLLWALALVVSLAKNVLSEGGGRSAEKGAGRRFKKRLRKAEKLAHAKDAGAFYAEIAAGLGDYLSDRLGRPVAGLTRPDLARRLTEAGAAQASVDELLSVLDACDAGRYAPGASEQTTMNDVLEKARRAHRALESIRLDDDAKEAA